MSAESQSEQNELTIALTVLHNEEYHDAFLEVLKKQGINSVVYTTPNDANNGRLLVRDAAAYVAIVGTKFGIVVPSYNNPERRILAEIELEEALRLGLPILLFVDISAGAQEVERDSERLTKIDDFRKRLLVTAFDPSNGQHFFSFDGLHEFQEIATAGVARLHHDLVAKAGAVKARQSKPKSAPNFSAAAEQVLDRARELAKKSNRAGVTSSCILFALSELAGKQNTTERFVRDSLESTGHYKEAFDRFLADASNPERASESEVPGLPGRASKNVAALLENSSLIAVRVSRDTDTRIFPRHIFAALLITPEGERNPVARRRLRDLGINIDKLCSEFLEFTRNRTDIRPEDPAQWAAILTTKPFEAGPAGYNSEFTGLGGSGVVEDQLGVKGWADQLAELIALRETKLPLAIGLFGSWGSGKSHFMNLIDRKLKSKMEEAHTDGNSSRWCTEIVPVYFNAWHYLDANLWASLVSQIFESLFVHLRPKTDQLQRVQELLEDASGATARAAEEVKVAEGVTRQARDELQQAQESRRAGETLVDGLLNGLRHLLPHVDAKKIQDQAAALLGVEQEVKTVDDLRQAVNEAQSFTTRARAVVKRLWEQPGRGWRLGWLLIVVLGGAAIVYFLLPQIPLLKDRLQGVGKQIATLLGALSAFLVWLRPIRAEMNKGLNQLESWANQAEAAQRDARETPAVKEARNKLTVATAKEEEARIRFAEAQRRENSLKEEALNLTPERRLGRFIEQRAQSQDYRGQLGLVSLARRDFQELSEIFADRKALQEKMAQADNAEKAKQLEDLSKSIDRIVLFVDDLDRCQPDKIVEVLQAVHLLLAFPLFAVVVGVDQPRLRQSLRMQLKGLLAEDLDERPATPLDYLEKIFHVPFHLPPMQEPGFKSLIDRLTEPATTTTDLTPPPPPKPPTTAPLPNSVDKEIEQEPPDHSAPEKEKEKKVDSTQPVQPGSISQTLQPWEREALQAYHPLIQTPRAAKRLLNTYRLVRASVPQSEWAAFSGDHRLDGEFRVTMLLLAAAAGYPAVARGWFAKLLTTPPAKLFEEMPEDDRGWTQFKSVYDVTFTTPPGHEIFIKWISRVERFAF